MTIFRWGLDTLNKLLYSFNLRLDTLTLDRLEQARLHKIKQQGWFDQVHYALPPNFKSSQNQFLLNELPKHQRRFKSFHHSGSNEVGFKFNNGFYGSPDAEILYSIVRARRPHRIVEIGCGNSTKIIRQAILDEELKCEHIAIDPQPRQEISRLVDIMIQQPIEHANAETQIEQLESGDILFIDTSHEVKPANDVAYIYGKLIPKLPSGVIVHIHDIFIPYEYPQAWVMDVGLKWGEQYIVHAMLMNSLNWEVLWPGYFLQQTMLDFDKYFPNRSGGIAQSLWLQKA